MAKTGVKSVIYAKATETAGVITYSDGATLGTTAGFNGTPTKSDVTDYGDNRSVETDNSVTGGTLSLEQNDLTLAEKAKLLGQTITETGELTASTGDIAPYVGIGAIGTAKRSGAAVFIGKWYRKVQFGEPTDENTSRQENTTFGHTTIEGKILMPVDGKWKVEQEFETEELALTWLKAKANITVAP